MAKISNRRISNKPLIFIAAACILLLGAAFFVGMVAHGGEPEKNTTTGKETTPASGDKAFLNHDMMLGDKDAPIEIIEYGSLSCPHCAHFHEEVFRPLKEQYLDTGKAKFIYRHYMRNVYDLDASQITLCLPEDRFFDMIGLLFKHQRSLMNSKAYRKFYRESDNKEEAIKKYREFVRSDLAKIAAMVGMERAAVDRCLANDKIPDYLFNVHKNGVMNYEVSGTPSIYVNGKRVYAADFETLEEAIREVK